MKRQKRKGSGEEGKQVTKKTQESRYLVKERKVTDKKRKEEEMKAMEERVREAG